MYEKKMRPAPYLKRLRESERLSQRRLAELAGVSRHTINGIEAGREGQPGTLRKLAAVLGALPEDLTGKPGIPPEQMEAYLDHLLTEKKTIGPGDPLYDNNLMATMTDAELAQFVRKNPAARQEVTKLMAQHRRMSAAVEQATGEREDEQQKDAS